MFDDASFITGLASLALMSVIFFINAATRADSWMRDDLVSMTLLSWVVGSFVLSSSSGVIGLVALLDDGFSMATLRSGGTAAMGLAACVGTVILFLSLAIRVKDRAPKADNITPFTPKPANGAGAPSWTPLKKAA